MLCKRFDPLAVLDYFEPFRRPGVDSQVCACKRAGQAGDGIRIAACYCAALNGGDRIFRIKQEEK